MENYLQNAYFFIKKILKNLVDNFIIKIVFYIILILFFNKSI